MIIPKELEAQKYKTKVLDHLGLVMGMCKEIGIIELIDEQISNESPDKILSTGNAIVGMILNGLGFVNKRLYLVSHFFETKAVDKLFELPYLKSEHFNDDALGRALDAVYEYGVNKLYAQISVKTVAHLKKEYGLELKNGQLDNTTFHLHGGEKELEETERILSITRGYSKDHRPDLVQIGLQLMVDSTSRIPLLMNVLSGNKEESKSYGEFIETYKEALNRDYNIEMLVVDSKLYNQKNLEILSGNPSMGWLTRVPQTISAVKEVIRYSDKANYQALEGYADYKYQEICSIYGGINHRWVVFHSATKREQDLQQLNKRFIKTSQRVCKELKKLSKQFFNSFEEAQQAAVEYDKKLKYNTLEHIEIHSKKHYAKRGKPKTGEQPSAISYYIEASVSSNIAAYEKEKEVLGYFVLASNKLNEQKYSPQDLLQQYKNQSSVERGFRFLKDDNLVASSLFVHKPQRMTAILMVMTLCLLVYSALEFATRTLLKKKNLTFENQLGKPIQNPSMKWIFECFEGIHILYIAQKQQVILNLNHRHRLVLDLLGQKFNHFYT